MNWLTSEQIVTIVRETNDVAREFRIR